MAGFIDKCFQMYFVACMHLKSQLLFCTKHICGGYDFGEAFLFRSDK